MCVTQPISLCQPASSCWQVQDLSFSLSTLRPVCDKFLSTKLLARGFKFLFLGLQFTNKVVIFQGYYLISRLVQGTHQKFILKDGFKMLLAGTFRGFKFVRSGTQKFFR